MKAYFPRALTLTALLFATTVSATFSATVAASELSVSGAYVREPVPGRAMSAAFLEITNQSEQPRELTSVTAEWAGSIEIHTHLHENGMMKMRQLPSLELPAKQSVTLKPGGLHLMLFNLNLPLAASLPMTLCFDNDECMDITATLWSPM